MTNRRDFLKFFLGFVGMVSLALSVLVLIGFYQIAVDGSKNISAGGAVTDGPSRTP